MKLFVLLTAGLLLLSGHTQEVSGATGANRPNILWITSEDNSPYLGCYGDKLANTPNLDKLATEGVRYRNAFSNAPVCSAARSTLISGMYASSLGTQHHRSQVKIPAGFKMYFELLQQAGYYCTNNAKTDYNIAAKRGGWDVSGSKAHYRNRRDGQPFFAVFNLMISHEGQAGAKAGKTEFQVSPKNIKLPPYHPDTPVIRRDWANYYDQMTQMDGQVGKLLSELEKEGLADNTIVFYYGDHGGALPRGKRNIHDSGTRVPLIIRFPKKWARLAPAMPGAWAENPVSFVDFAPSVFNLCGVPIPKNYQGIPFLGEDGTKPREHVFLYRGRMDERYDTVRSIRDKEFQYIRNYSPHRPWGQHYSYTFNVMPCMQSWLDEFTAGRCNAVQAAFWQPKPGEELYQISSDPFEVRNLATESAEAARLASMRAILRTEILTTRDTGFIPEGMFKQLAGSKTIHEYAQSPAYPLEQILTLADETTERDPARLPGFIAALSDPHPVVRYWAATGCLILKENAAPAKTKLEELLADRSADVRLVAAESLAYLGEAEAAVKSVAAVLKSGNLHEVLAAQNTLDFMWQAGHVSLPEVKRMVAGTKLREPGDRIPTYFLEQP
ncbi:MAG: sulfatase-like hydrolase/transferase [Akkermansiaceae bacterium]